MVHFCGQEPAVRSCPIKHIYRGKAFQHFASSPKSAPAGVENFIRDILGRGVRGTAPRVGRASGARQDGSASLHGGARPSGARSHEAGAGFDQSDDLRSHGARLGSALELCRSNERFGPEDLGYCSGSVEKVWFQGGDPGSQQHRDLIAELC